ncbi:E motif [Dillenia turbinata]|uniref:E motif n=1 Tax=Dillenia turbinata TaxID=194707 RepID=A0AAN8ZI58_9MAGN
MSSVVLISASPTVYHSQKGPLNLRRFRLRFSCEKTKSNINSYNNTICNPFLKFSQDNRLSRGDEKAHNAQKMFDEMSDRNEPLCSSLILSHVNSGNFSQAFSPFEMMIREGIRPNGLASGGLLKASSYLNDFSLGRQLHGWYIRAGFGLDVEIRMSLLAMYSNFGMLDEARRVFDETPICALNNASFWILMINSYVLHRCWSEVIRMFGEMLSVGLVGPREFVTVVNACGSSGEEKGGRVIHGMIIKDRLTDVTHVMNSLVTFYARCGNLEDANKLFKTISRKDTVSWNSIIAANEQNGDEGSALEHFREMLRVGPELRPSRVTFLSVLSAVCGVSDLKLGREVHAQILHIGLEADTSIANSLITMYAKYGEMDKSRAIFENLVVKDLITWNSMLAGFEQNGQQESCFEFIRRMLSVGNRPDTHSLTIAISAVSLSPCRLSFLRTGKEIHGYVLKRANLTSVPIHNAMITMYGKYNQVEHAEKIFVRMGNRDSCSWNAMMDCYLTNSHVGETQMIFLDIFKERMSLDHLSFSIILTSCSRLASLHLGKQIHSVTFKLFNDQRYPYKDALLSINNALISMYSKCGSINDAAKVFSSMERRDVFSWTAMITGYAFHGMASESLEMFDRMKANGLQPNHITFLGVLTACAHRGLVEEGTNYFHSMMKDYGLNPSIEHYACMVDQLARSCQFDRAKSMVEIGITSIGPKDHNSPNLWKVLLGACHVHKQLELGVEAATKILELDPEDEATYILLSNLYVSSGLWEKAISVRKAMRDKGLGKEPGYSWIEIGNRRHIFVAGDDSHPLRKEIYEKLDELDFRLRKICYTPTNESTLNP